MDKLKIAVVALVMVTLSLGFFLLGRDTASPAVKVKAVGDSTSTSNGQYDAPIMFPLSTSVATSAVPAAVSAQPAPRQSEFGRQLLGATSIKRFVIDALKHPESGGGYYALLALGQCDSMEPKDSLVQLITERDGKIAPELLTKITSTRDRCDGLTEPEMEAIKTAAKKLGAEGRDPILAMQLRLRQAQTDNNEAEFNRQLDELFKSGNLAYASHMGLIDRMLQAKSTFGSDGTQTVIFNGKIYTDPVEITALDLAASMSLCNEHDYCAIDTRMLNACRNSGQCYASREAYMQQYLQNKEPRLFENFERFTREMRAAIARGDSSIFR